MILESIVTSLNNDGVVNVAPMGPTVDEAFTQITLRPFKSSRTYQNLIQQRKAVVHVTDNVMLFAKAAVDALTVEEMQSLVQPLETTGLFRLRDCHRYFVVDIDTIAEDNLRATLKCRIVDSGVVRPFFGFNRAKHAVIEAAILATRTHLIAADELQDQLSRLRPLVDKTAGSDEHAAFEFLVQTINERLAANHCN
ncbi:hypothetical protein Pla22_01090 [Rubripirellula amarantea]|uniref:DUF447 family protein n=1 Tax=Rubripirellula amarantea TaxID=2527999 RepID=A0A5C5WQD5_9BACT|nr:DUF447 domain-containing protein [Rubripirellula amarantea]TWT52485.1 hypothetical protein Pla22_01090 [Rubripirellula amarantea]